MKIHIRKYLVIVLVLLVVVGGVLFWAFRLRGNGAARETMKQTAEGNLRIARTKGDAIQIYQNKKWKTVPLQAVLLSTYYPGSGRAADEGIRAALPQWLSQIVDMGANAIYVPQLQESFFYEDLRDFNTTSDTPIYILQGIPLREETVQEVHDAFDERLIDELGTDSRITVDALHGSAVTSKTPSRAGGIYTADVSPWVLGYVVGENSSAELGSLTNEKYEEKTVYEGTWLSVKSGNAFTCFAAQMMDEILTYEQEKYTQLSLISYYAFPDIDPLSHANETNRTRYADLDLEKVATREGGRCLFAGYYAHPNDVDYLPYDHVQGEDNTAEDDHVQGEDNTAEDDHVQGEDKTVEDAVTWYTYGEYVRALTAHHGCPVVILNIGLSTSRAVSRTDETKSGCRRGGMSEKQQGNRVVQLLETIKEAGCAGAVINRWQDDWTHKTPFNYVELFPSNDEKLWQNVQASDECFGLLRFSYGEEQDICTIDGDDADWANTAVTAQTDMAAGAQNSDLDTGQTPAQDSALDAAQTASGTAGSEKQEMLSVSAQADTAYLYLLVRKTDMHFAQDRICIGLDVTADCGSDTWKEENRTIRFSRAVDFILDMRADRASRFLVQERADIFSYQYRYYTNVLEGQDVVPAADSSVFEPLLMLNRKSFYLRTVGSYLDPLYTDSASTLHYGDGDPDSRAYDSLTDYHVTGDVMELRIPWSMLNIVNPVNGTAVRDAYADTRQGQTGNVGSIGISVHYLGNDGTDMLADGSYRLANLRSAPYHTRLKQSYAIIQNYWMGK